MSESMALSTTQSVGSYYMWNFNVPLIFSKNLQPKEFCNETEGVDGHVTV